MDPEFVEKSLAMFKESTKLSSEFMIILVVIGSIEISLAIFGNFFVIYGLITEVKRGQNVRKSNANEVGTKELISALVGMLAIDDILMALMNIGLLLNTAFNESEWQFGNLFCKLRDPIIATVVGISCTLMAVIATLRYHSLANPRYRSALANILISNTRLWIVAFIIVMSIATLHIVLSTPAIIHGELHRATFTFTIKTNDSDIPEMKEYTAASYCLQNWSSPTAYIIYYLGQFVLSFALPLTITFVIHFKVIMYIARNSPKIMHGGKYLRKTTVLLIAILTTFTICWLPYKLLVLIIDIFTNSSTPTLPPILTNRTLIHCLKLLTMAQPCINPIMYGFYNRQIRQNINSSLRKMSFIKDRINFRLSYSLLPFIIQAEGKQREPLTNKTAESNKTPSTSKITKSQSFQILENQNILESLKETPV